MVQFTGGCLCGQIRYSQTACPEYPHFCTCHMCQKWTGAPVVAWADFPLDSLTWDGPGGEPTMYPSSEETRRGFCPRCGGTLCALDEGSTTICMTVATLDDPGAVAPTSHSFPESAPAWLEVKSRPS